MQFLVIFALIPTYIPAPLLDPVRLLRQQANLLPCVEFRAEKDELKWQKEEKN